MTVPEKAIDWAVSIAHDDSHGYDQTSRWGADYDCSSLVISAYKKAGVPLTCTYTGNMYDNMTKNGFKDVTSKVNLSSGSGLKAGDVLLNHVHHTALYIGSGMMVEATGNELGKITGGAVGDQTGREIAINPYRNYGYGGWNAVLRYSKNVSTEEAPVPQTTITPSDLSVVSDDGYYIVKSGDSLWAISERFLGSGARYAEIQRENGLTSSMINVGQRLKIPGAQKDKHEVEPSAPTSGKINVKLPLIKPGSKGNAVKIFQFALNICGASPALEIDGEFGEMTLKAMNAYQTECKIQIGDIVQAEVWESIFE